MKKIYLKYSLFCALIFGLLLTGSCKKDWLDAKPNKTLIVPETLEDIEALLNSFGDILISQDPGLGEVGADNYVLADTQLPSLTLVDRNAYYWAADVFGNQSSVQDWSLPYRQVVVVNVALEALEKIKEDAANTVQVRRLTGIALFYRSWSFFALMGVFAKPYDPATANTDIGIPLRLSSNINEKVGRSTVQQCYEKIISDLRLAADLLNVDKPNKIRASKEAAYGLLSRVYLSMKDYEQASVYANECLKLSGKLIDYNTLDVNAAHPFTELNEEVIYNRAFVPYLGIGFYASMDKDLYTSYDANDLRKYLFFMLKDNNPMFKGNYYDGYPLFCGIAADELYLTRAECSARKGNIVAAMNDLNDLLRTRWRYKPGTTESSFIDLTASNADDALNQILMERRKELLMRGIRWIDLRRLNTDPRFAKTLTRVVNGQTYTLLPNSNRYVYPIPDDEVLYSGIPQNVRN